MKRLSRKEEEQLLHECMTGGRKDKIVDQYYYHLIGNIIQKGFYKKGIFFSKDHVEELRNDVFVKLFENKCRRLAQYDPEKGRGLASWIMLITTQTVVDSLEKKDPHSISGYEKLVSIEDIKESFEWGKEQKRLEKKEELNLVIEKSKKLTPSQRLIFQLHYLDDMPLEEIAKMTNRTVKAVYSIKFRAIQRLKELIKRL